MKTIADLKKRLEALPGRRIGRGHEGKYAQFFRKSSAAKENLVKASVALPLAASVLPSTDYRQPAKSIKTAVGIARRLADKLNEDPAAISEPNTEERFVRLGEHATAALNKAQAAWSAQLQSKTEKWETLAGVLSGLDEEDDAKSVKAQATKMKGAIRSLRAAESKLPQTDEDAAEVANELKTLTESVSKLDLETPFGKFLRATASEEGAGLDLLQSEEVSKSIAKLKLQKVFRVRLS